MSSTTAAVEGAKFSTTTNFLHLSEQKLTPEQNLALAKKFEGEYGFPVVIERTLRVDRTNCSDLHEVTTKFAKDKVVVTLNEILDCANGVTAKVILSHTGGLAEPLPLITNQIVFANPPNQYKEAVDKAAEILKEN